MEELHQGRKEASDGFLAQNVNGTIGQEEQPEIVVQNEESLNHLLFPELPVWWVEDQLNKLNNPPPNFDYQEEHHDGNVDFHILHPMQPDSQEQEAFSGHRYTQTSPGAFEYNPDEFNPDPYEWLAPIHQDLNGEMEVLERETEQMEIEEDEEEIEEDEEEATEDVEIGEIPLKRRGPEPDMEPSYSSQEAAQALKKDVERPGTAKGDSHYRTMKQSDAERIVEQLFLQFMLLTVHTRSLLNIRKMIWKVCANHWAIFYPSLEGLPRGINLDENKVPSERPTHPGPPNRMPDSQIVQQLKRGTDKKRRLKRSDASRLLEEFYFDLDGQAPSDLTVGLLKEMVVARFGQHWRNFLDVQPDTEVLGLPVV